MFYILYEDQQGRKTWELVDGADAMEIRVSELMQELNCEAEDVIVFSADDEIE